MNGHTSSNGAAGTPLSNTSLSNSARLPLTNDNAFQFLTTLIVDPVVHINSIENPFNSEQAFYQHPHPHPQQHSTFIEQDLQQQQQQRHNKTISQPAQRVESDNQHTVNTIQHHRYDMNASSSPVSTNCGNELSPISSNATRTPNSTNSTPILSQGNNNLRDPPLSSNTPSLQLSDSSFDLGLHRSHHENTYIMYGVPGHLETTANDHHHTIHLSSGPEKRNNPTDVKIDHMATNRQHLQSNDGDLAINEQHCQTQLHHSQYHQFQQFISSNAGSTLTSQMLGSESPSFLLSSNQKTNKDHAAPANQSNISNQETIQPSSSNQSNIAAPDSSNYPISFDTNDGGNRVHGKRSKKEHLETNPTTEAPFTKKIRHDTTTHHQSDQDTEPSAIPRSTSHFTAASFQKMTREQMVDRLVNLENERIDLVRRLEEKTILASNRKDSNLVPVTADNNNLASNDTIGKNNKAATGDDDDDDDEDEEVESVSSAADVNADGINNSNMEMKCLWKNCGITCIGVLGLTDHIIGTHIGGGKSLYRCEWENCRRNQKPFTKRHKLCNHLRTHSGERPFVCDKAGCEKRFSRPDSLITHIKTHSTIRPFVCHIPGCDKAYYHARSLKKHIKLHGNEKVNENGGSTLDSDNSNIDLSASYVPTATTASPGIQPTQPQQHLYPFQEQIALTQFTLHPGSNTTTSSMSNKQLLDPSLYDASHSLFNPLAFQDLASIQTPPFPQQQFMPMNPTSHVSIPASMTDINTNVNMMNQSNASLQPQQQSIDEQQNEYSIPLFL